MAEPSKLENAQQPGDPALPNNPDTPREDLVSASAIAPPPPQPVDFKELWSASDALARAKALRNFFQLERDKIHAYWEISKRELEDIKSEIRNKEKEKEEIKERHQVERKVFKQKIRHVLYEQNAQIVQLKTEAERSLKVRMEEQRDAENDLQLDVRQLKQSKNELELQLRDEIMRTKQLHARELTEQRRAQEQALREMQIKYEKRIKSLREEMESQRKLEIDSIERRKAEHIKELRTTHDKAFADMKDYFNNITSSNLDTINTLKDEVTARKKTEMTNEKMMFEIAQQNKRLTEPLTKALNEQSTLKEELTNYERDKASLAETKKELDKLEKAHKTLEWEHEVLRQRSERLVTERDEIRNRYQDVLSELEQKAIFKQIVLHKKVEVVQAQIERKEAQVSELLKETTSNDESSNSTRAVSEKVNQLVSSKNTLLEDLQNLLVNVTQRHEVIITAYETYFAQNGISGLSSHPRDKPNS